jgi:signal transduction histidine kinase
LRSEREDLDAARDRRNDALAFVSHELRQPLSNIHLAASILEKNASEDTRLRAVTLIRRSATRLGRMVDDLADVTLLHASAIRINRSDTPLQEVLFSAVESSRPVIEQRQQLLTTDIPLDPPLLVSGDSLRLQQVFSNVLGNASKYSPEGAEISLTCREENGRGIVVVRDTGVGIRADMLETIFAPFVREPGRGSDGLGIGLALARTLVGQHGGNITASSNGPGQGSTFTIELPLLG